MLSWEKVKNKKPCRNFQVELTEYVKVEDVLYKVNNNSLVPEERLVHDRHVTFPVSDIIMEFYYWFV